MIHSKHREIKKKGGKRKKRKREGDSGNERQKNVMRDTSFSKDVILDFKSKFALSTSKARLRSCKADERSPDLL